MSEVHSIEARLAKQLTGIIASLSDRELAILRDNRKPVDPPLSDARQRVHDLLSEQASLTPAQLIVSLATNPNTMRSTLKKMLYDGQIVRSRDGRYSLPD